MRGLMKEMNLKPNPAIKIALVSALLLLGGWLVLRRFEIEVGVTEPESVPVIKTNPSANGDRDRGTVPLPTTKPDVARAVTRQGTLRISNRSTHPLRVALLSKQPKANDTKSGATSAARFEAPAHWDFAPSEGSEKGLLVSLPDRNITLKKGDVVVAFAQDGSQRYWGPYIVGETDRPTWNSQTAEWELVLE
jgi:hypothetical protein